MAVYRRSGLRQAFCTATVLVSISGSMAKFTYANSLDWHSEVHLERFTFLNDQTFIVSMAVFYQSCGLSPAV